MASRHKLFLHEEIMLLSLRDEEGTIEFGANYHMAVGGAILAELLLENRIAVDESRKRKLADLVSDAPLGDPLIDECLAKVAAAKRRAALSSWVSRFANLRQIKHRTAQGLCRRGILRAEEDKVLFLFTRKVYPEVDPGPERELIERLRAAIFTDTEEVDPRTVVLLSLADAAGLLKIPFDRKELKKRKKRIEQVVNGEMTGKATREAILAMQAAVVVAAIIPAVVVTTTAGS